MSAFSLPIAPAVLAAPPSVAIRTLPYHLRSKSTASVELLAPFIFGAGALDQ